MKYKKNSLFSLLSMIEERLAQRYADKILCKQYAWWLIEALTGYDQTELMLDECFVLTTEQHRLLEDWIIELVEHAKPLQYILGSVPFGDLDICVVPPTLIPRPETEEWCLNLIERLRKEQKEPKKILDLCTGSGCIALLFANAFPTSKVLGTDITLEAIDLARENAFHNGIHNVEIIESNIFKNVPHEKYDLIVSNPPYIPHEKFNDLDDSVKLWEDPQALIAEDSGLAIIKQIIAQAPNYLAPQGICALEIDHTQGNAVIELMHAANFSNVSIEKDLEGKDRVVMGNINNVAATNNQ